MIANLIGSIAVFDLDKKKLDFFFLIKFKGLIGIFSG